jgi:hypothetical protein
MQAGRSEETDHAGDQAEAIFPAVGGRLSKTTGQVISVDAGLADAFLR